MPRIQLRRDTAANWTSANPTLAAGEMGAETDTRRIKIGTGSAAWTALAYLDAGPPQVVAAGGGAIANLTSGQQAVITTGTVVTTTDGRRWIYSGTGSKTSEASYIELADVTPTWDSIASKPSTFTPSSHTHAISDVTSLQTALDGKQASGAYADASHSHTVSDISDFPTVSANLYQLDDVDDNIQYANNIDLLVKSGSGWNHTNLSSGASGYFYWDGSAWSVNSGAGGGGGASNLYQLDDVDDNALYASANNFLVSSSSGWYGTNLSFASNGNLYWDGTSWTVSSGSAGASSLHELSDVDDGTNGAMVQTLIYKDGSGIWRDTGSGNGIDSDNYLRAYFDDSTSPGHALILDSAADSRVTRLNRGAVAVEDTSSGMQFFVDTTGTSYSGLYMTMSGLPTDNAGLAANQVWVDSSGYLRFN